MKKNLHILLTFSFYLPLFFFGCQLERPVPIIEAPAIRLPTDSTAKRDYVVEVTTPQGITSKSDISAFSALKNDHKYKLISNVSFKNTLTVPSGISIILDLNGYIFEGSGSHSVITNRGRVVLRDSDSSIIHKYIVKDDLYLPDDIEGTVEIPGGLITGGFASMGGGIRNYGNFIMEAGVIVGNSARYYGGGVYNESSGVFTFSNGRIVGNRVISGDGGGIHNEGVLTVSGTANISDNTAVKGGGISNAPDATANIDGGHIVDNTATSKGGGVNNSGTLNVKGDSIISENTAEDGGGINNASGGTTNITGGIISDNESSENGGGINNSGGDLNIAGGEIKDNTAGKDGGSINTENSGNTTISDGSVSGDMANEEGSTTEVVGGSVTDDEFVSGDSDVEDDGDGGVVVRPTSVQVILSNGNIELIEIDAFGILNKNWATYKLLGNVELLTNLTVTQGNTVAIDLNGFILKGTGNGSVITNHGNLTVIDSRSNEVHKYKAGDGLYILDDAAGTITISGGAITGGVKNGNGGGVNNLGSLTMESGVIVGNSASDSGGGVYNSGTFTMNAGRIVGNKSGNGGGLSNSIYGIAEIQGGAISENRGNNGGGVHNLGTLTLNPGEIKNNTGVVDGGGIFNSGNLTINEGSSVSDNTAIKGGGVHNTTNGTITMVDGEIKDNNSTSKGGGINNSGGTVTIVNGEISGNTATSGGDSINTDTRGTTSITGGAVSGDMSGETGSTTEVLGGSVTDREFIDTDAELEEGPDGTVVVHPNLIQLTTATGKISYITPSEFTSMDSNYGTYKLLKNTALSDELTVPEGKTVTLDLNGHVLKAAKQKRVIRNYGDLTITDSNPTAIHRYIPGNVQYTWNDEEGTETILGGAITGGYSISEELAGGIGGGIFSTGPHLRIKGGNIVGNYANDIGGGILLRQTGNLTISGGAVVGNSCGNPDKSGIGGGGIIAAGNMNVVISGGAICNNRAFGFGPAGLYANCASFLMTGGEIYGNKLNPNDTEEGLDAIFGAELNISDDCEAIMENGFIDGKIYISNTTLTMRGGALGSSFNIVSESGKIDIYGGYFTRNPTEIKGANVLGKVVDNPQISPFFPAKKYPYFVSQ